MGDRGHHPARPAQVTRSLTDYARKLLTNGFRRLGEGDIDGSVGPLDVTTGFDLEFEAQLRPNVPMPTTVVRARVERSRARMAERILSRMGLKPSDAVNMLYAQIVQQRRIPFALVDAGSDYAQTEYGLTADELDRWVKRMDREVTRERKSGTIRRLTSPDDLR